MAEAIVPHLLQILGILHREWDRASKYKQELSQLKFLIELFDGFLKKANSMETIDDEIKSSMKQAREFIYDSQDAIDDLMRHESNCRLRCLLLFCRRRFVSQANDIITILHRYNDVKVAIEGLLPQLPAERAISSLDSSSSIAYSQENDNQLKGIDDARVQLVRWLTADSMSKVIFVHGAQGVGKTSLVGTVLRNQQVKNRFKYYVWINGLRSYDVLMEEKVVMWDLTNDNQQDQVKLKEAFDQMRNDKDLRFNQKKWALVLDDARNLRVIEDLQRHLDQTRPSVLITTRDSSLELCSEKLASASRTSADTPEEQSGGAPPEKHGYVYSLFKFAFGNPASKPRAGSNSQQPQSSGEAPDSLNGFLKFKHVSLSMNHSLELLRREMSNNADSNDLEEDSKSILKTCEGLPLAILATCDLVKHIRRGNNGIVIWKDLSSRLGEELLSKRNPTDLIRRMITLPMEQLHDVRACLFYLSIFPLNCRIRCSTLVRLWMAEKFAMQDNRGRDRAMADEQLRNLLDRNFIQEVEKTSYGRPRTCCVPKLQHEIIMKKSKDDEFAMIVADHEENLPESIWRLSFHSSLHKSGSADESQIERVNRLRTLLTRVRRLRSLLVFDEAYPESMEELLRQVVRLKVLHLEASSLKSFPKGIPRLKYLRYLKLSGTGVETIPKDIGDLAYLETLDLKGTCVSELPGGILELKALRHLLVYRSDRSPDADDPKFGVKAPSALGGLKLLQKLCMIELNPVKQSKKQPWKREQLLGELGKLTSLGRLGITKLKSEDVKLLFSSITKLTNLEALHLIAVPGEEINLPLDDTRKAPACLQRVHLTGCFRRLKNWLHSPDKLVKLVLKRSQLNPDELQHLGELRGLKHLELQEAFDVREMTFREGWFPQLRFLGLDTIKSLDSIKVEENALPTLEILSLARCQSLEATPQDITRPGKLTCLELNEMPNQFKREVERNARVRAQMTVKVKAWNRGAVEVVMTLPERPAGSPSDPRPLKK